MLIVNASFNSLDLGILRIFISIMQRKEHKMPHKNQIKKWLSRNTWTPKVKLTETSKKERKKKLNMYSHVIILKRIYIYTHITYSYIQRNI